MKNINRKSALLSLVYLILILAMATFATVSVNLWPDAVLKILTVALGIAAFLYAWKTGYEIIESSKRLKEMERERNSNSRS